MCYSKNVSMYAFIAGITVSLYLFNKPQKDLKIIGGFFFFVSFMQLFDYIFWTHPKDNELTTKVACIFNHLQPIVLAYLIYRYTGNLKLKIFVIHYAIAAFIYTSSNWDSLKRTDIDPTTGSLYWSWNHWKHAEYFYGFFLLLCTALCYYNLSAPYNKIMALLFPLTFFMSYMKYGAKFIGRFWCYFSAYIPLIFLLV